MLEYEWGNPSPIMFTGDENPPDTGLNRQILDPYGTHNFNEPSSVAFINPNAQFDTTQEEHNHHHNNHNHNHHHHHQQLPFIGSHHFHHSIYDTLAVFGAESSYTQGSLHSLEPSGSTGYMVVPKSEPLVDFNNAGGARIGLNLGGRTYFASSEDDFVSRLYRRSRISEPGSVNSPRCQAEGCNADLSNSKHYHRRHKVCEFHSKAATVITAGLTQRFCQQCSRFHLLTEFDNGKRSCRKRLADHNRRRRKSQQPLPPPPPSQQHSNKSLRDNASNSASKDIARSTPESGAHSSSTMASAVSRQKVSFDRFKQKSYQVGSNSSASAKIVSNWD